MENGGHTRGFKRIARVIDKWAGGLLQLRNVKADLRAFSLEGEIEQSKSTSTSGAFQPPEGIRNMPQRLPRIDRARYMRVAEMSRESEMLETGGRSNTPRQGWSGFVAFAENSPG